jgi:hypothetical protein
MLCKQCEAISFLIEIEDHKKLLMPNIICEDCDMSSVLGVLSVPWHTFIYIYKLHAVRNHSLKQSNGILRG